MSKEKSGMLGIRDIVFMNVIAILLNSRFTYT